MKVVVGSTNPVKIKATENIMKRVYGEDVEIIGIEVDSGVSVTPLSDEELLKGAINRAKEAMLKTNADLSVGLEGGIVERCGKYFLTGLAVIMDKNNEISIGYGGGIELPKFVVEEVKKGKELGDVMDSISGIKDSKRKIGGIGILTKGLKTRQEAWEDTLINALAKRLSPELYKSDEGETKTNL